MTKFGLSIPHCRQCFPSTFPDVMSVRRSQTLPVVEELQEESGGVEEEEDEERQQEGDDDGVQKPQDPGEVVNIQRENVVPKPDSVVSDRVKYHLHSPSNLCKNEKQSERKKTVTVC